ncbi:MAG: preprotein translocase subunit SecE [Gaiellaceae bacterium]
MARPTRQQRRARRGEGSGQTLAEQSRAARQARSLQVQRPQAGRQQERERRGFAPFRFMGESAGELKKVDWPGRQQLVQGTIVVILACAIVGSYLFGCDVVLKRFVQTVLLGQ